MHDDIADFLIDKFNGKLFDLARSHSYPLSKDIGIGALKHGMTAAGLNVETDEDRQEAEFTIGLFNPRKNKIFDFTKTWTYDYLLRGDGRYPYGSLKVLEQFGYDLFDDVKTAAPNDMRDDSLGRELRMKTRMHNTALSDYVQSRIAKLRDAAFVDRFLFPVMHEGPSDILPKILGRQDLSYYERAQEIHYDGNSWTVSSPAAHELLKIDWRKFNDQYWPTPSTLERYYWGLYLYDVAHVKGYDTNVAYENSREYFIKEGAGVLLEGNEMNWGSAAYTSHS